MLLEFYDCKGVAGYELQKSDDDLFVFDVCGGTDLYGCVWPIPKSVEKKIARQSLRFFI